MGTRSRDHRCLRCALGSSMRRWRRHHFPFPCFDYRRWSFVRATSHAHDDRCLLPSVTRAVPGLRQLNNARPHLRHAVPASCARTCGQVTVLLRHAAQSGAVQQRRGGDNAHSVWLWLGRAGHGACPAHLRHFSDDVRGDGCGAAQVPRNARPSERYIGEGLERNGGTHSRELHARHAGGRRLHCVLPPAPGDGLLGHRQRDHLPVRARHEAVFVHHKYRGRRDNVALPRQGPRHPTQRRHRASGGIPCGAQVHAPTRHVGTHCESHDIPSDHHGAPHTTANDTTTDDTDAFPFTYTPARDGVARTDGTADTANTDPDTGPES
eukprot:PhM_4_TR10499/c0_g2_i1/m.88666